MYSRCFTPLQSLLLLLVLRWPHLLEVAPSLLVPPCIFKDSLDSKLTLGISCQSCEQSFLQGFLIVFSATFYLATSVRLLGIHCYWVDPCLQTPPIGKVYRLSPLEKTTFNSTFLNRNFSNVLEAAVTFGAGEGNMETPLSRSIWWSPLFPTA